MKPSGPKHERETIVRWDDETDSLDIWTASGAVFAKLRKLGWHPYEDGERHACFKIPLSSWRWPRQPSKARAEAARRAFERRNQAATPPAEQKPPIL